MLIDLLFPNRCLHCNRIITEEALVCEVCFGLLHFTHFNFVENNELTEKCRLLFPVKNAFALMYFEKESLVREVIHTLKYRNRDRAGKIIADWASERLHFENQKPDLLVTVPLHPRKLRERGYNQLTRFAQEISQIFDIKYEADILKRNFYRKAQATKNKKQRSDTSGLFSAAKITGAKHILLIDDVFTTGNTISTAAWTLLDQNPAAEISILVMAFEA